MQEDVSVPEMWKTYNKYGQVRHNFTKQKGHIWMLEARSILQRREDIQFKGPNVVLEWAKEERAKSSQGLWKRAQLR